MHTPDPDDDMRAENAIPAALWLLFAVFIAFAVAVVGLPLYFGSFQP